MSCYCADSIVALVILLWLPSFSAIQYWLLRMCLVRVVHPARQLSMPV
jgi:hypothetical protein